MCKHFVQGDWKPYGGQLNKYPRQVSGGKNIRGVRKKTVGLCTPRLPSTALLTALEKHLVSVQLEQAPERRAKGRPEVEREEIDRQTGRVKDSQRH